VGKSEPTVSTRSYSMGARREAVDETRLAITEAVMRLHERVGPRATTVSGIAEEAQVTRATVYKHFPDDEALVLACATHWGRLHPPPDPTMWSTIAEPVARLRTALRQTYEWATTAAPMMSMIYRDVDAMPAFIGDFLIADENVRVNTLVRPFRANGRRAKRMSAAVAHALRATTWQSLCADGGLSNADAVGIMVGAVLAAADQPTEATA
jgi:AcrR family transcriptional regulator